MSGYRPYSVYVWAISHITHYYVKSSYWENNLYLLGEPALAYAQNGSVLVRTRLLPDSLNIPARLVFPHLFHGSKILARAVHIRSLWRPIGDHRGNSTFACRSVPTKALECVRVSYRERRLVRMLTRAIAQAFELVRPLRTVVTLFLCFLSIPECTARLSCILRSTRCPKRSEPGGIAC